MTLRSFIILGANLSSFEPNAESQCETYLAQALQIEPITPEVYQTLASVRLSQQRVDEAKAALAQGLAIWLGSDRKFPFYFIQESTTFFSVVYLVQDD